MCCRLGAVALIVDIEVVCLWTDQLFPLLSAGSSFTPPFMSNPHRQAANMKGMVKPLKAEKVIKGCDNVLLLIHWLPRTFPIGKIGGIGNVFHCVRIER